MEKFTSNINGTSLSIWVRIINKGDFKGIANVNFGWFENAGFIISYFKGNSKSGYDAPRRKDCLTVEPPKYGRKYAPAFRTTASIKDPTERDRVRKQYWYNLVDAIIDAYYWTLEKNDQPSESSDREEVNLSDLDKLF